MFGKALTLLSVAGLIAAHAGCDDYQHGVDLYKRDPSQDKYVERLRARYGPVSARVLGQNEIEKRAAPTTYAATLTRVNTQAAMALSSGTGTPEVTSPLPAQPTPGAASPVRGAPPLPAVVINPADWPALDRPPPTDTPQVAQWLAELDLSGIPNYAPTGVGGCQNTTYNAQAIAEAQQRGWWTCGGWGRATDVSFCPQRNTWGLSYDDGPSPYTPKLLDYLDAAQLKTTIFTVGSRVISRPDILQYEYLAGHQIAVHTWSHFPLTTLTNEQIVAELGWSKRAIYAVTGVTPKYMRPPYGDIDDRVRYISMMMGLTPVLWTRHNGQAFDTQDWHIAGGVVNTSTVIQNFDQILATAPQLSNGFIVLQHDLYQQSVNLAIDYVMPTALQNNQLSLQSIVQCLGFDLAQAYVETATNSTNGPTSQIAGASDTGFVPGLTSTPPALGGMATGSSISQNSPTHSGLPSGVSQAVVPSSKATTFSVSATLLATTALVMLALA